jgi:hypothetical protein
VEFRISQMVELTHVFGAGSILVMEMMLRCPQCTDTLMEAFYPSASSPPLRCAHGSHLSAFHGTRTFSSFFP